MLCPIVKMLLVSNALYISKDDSELGIYYWRVFIWKFQTLNIYMESYQLTTTLLFKVKSFPLSPLEYHSKNLYFNKDLS